MEKIAGSIRQSWRTLCSRFQTKPCRRTTGFLTLDWQYKSGRVDKQRLYDMNGIFQMQGGKNRILPK
jgi:hypothetical protein